MKIGLGLRLAVHAHYLLPRGVRRARQDAGLGHGRVTFVLQNSAHGNVLVAKRLEQQASGLIVADHADRQHVDAQIREILDRIRAAAGHDAALPMFKNQNRSLARHPRDFGKNKFVRHQVAKHGDCDFGK